MNSRPSGAVSLKYLHTHPELSAEFRTRSLFGRRARRGRGLVAAVAVTAGLLLAGVSGCARNPELLGADAIVLDPGYVAFPEATRLTLIADGLNAPSDFGFVPASADVPEAFKGAMVIAEPVTASEPVRVGGFKADGEWFELYPRAFRLAGIQLGGDRLYGPVGGVAVLGSEVFLSHRDREGRGVISALTFPSEGRPPKRRIVVENLPAAGDHGVTDVAVNPTNGRIYFGVGSATNSGVVGLDSFQLGWVRKHPKVADQSLTELRLRGYRFDTPRPGSGLFASNLAVTGPFQPFGQTRQRIAPSDRPTGAVYSVAADGSDLRVEAHGLRWPRGLAFNEFGNLYVSNNGMELRGTRPVASDPDVVLRVPLLAGSRRATWFGFPDFSADLQPVTLPQYQPPTELIEKTGYPELSFLVDHEASGLVAPDSATLLRGVLPPQAGAAKMAVVGRDAVVPVPEGHVLVAAFGDRGQFANADTPRETPAGSEVWTIDTDRKSASRLIYNRVPGPASESYAQPIALERPVSVKVGPDGAVYVLDAGPVSFSRGRPRAESNKGRIFKLDAAPVPASTSPADDPSASSPAE